MHNCARKQCCVNREEGLADGKAHHPVVGAHCLLAKQTMRYGSGRTGGALRKHPPEGWGSLLDKIAGLLSMLVTFLKSCWHTFAFSISENCLGGQF